MKAAFLDGEGRLRSGWKALGFLLLLAALNFGLLMLFKAVPALRAVRASGWVGALVPTLMALAATAICLRLERRPLASVGLRFDRRWLLEFLAGTAGGVLLLVMAALAVRATGAFHWERNAAVGAGELLRWAGIFLGVACFEELVFRGYPFQRLVQGALGARGTLALFALFFAFAHWGNPGMTGATKAWASLNIALAAVLLGFQVSGTGSAGFLRPVLDPRSPDWVHGGAFGLEATLACAVLCAAACGALWFWRPAPRR